MHTSYDIIIVGGGIVGLTLACLLAEQTTLSIAVIEAKSNNTDWSPDRYAPRVSAIALSSQRLFASLNLWEAMRTKRVSPFNRIEVWDAVKRGEIQFSSQEIAEPVLGFIVENNVIQSVLEAKIQSYPTIQRLTGIHLTALDETSDGIKLTTQDQRTFHANLVIAADGANSWVREQAGITVQRYDYEQTAIVATVETALPHQQTARQVFLPDGPLAFLPLRSPNLSSIVWSLPPARAQALLAMELETFKQALADAFDNRLGTIHHVEDRLAFPLAKQQAKQYIKSSLALVGDAAQVVHPLAGQGVNIGLQEVSLLANIITKAVRHRRSYSSIATLRAYERRSKAEHAILMTGIDLIKSLFASDQTSLQRLRSFGLETTNRTQWLKNIFTRHAVGTHR